MREEKAKSFSEKKIMGREFTAICHQLDIGNIIDYENDKKRYSYDKLCLIKIENAELLLDYLGENFYFDHLGKALLEIHQYLLSKNYDGIISAYCIDKSTFAVAEKAGIDDDFFIKLIDKLHKNFQYIKPEKTNAPILIRFAVVLNQPNLLERAIEELQSTRNMQKHYIICDNTLNVSKNIQKELDMINTVYWALQNDGVIPYYQGLYDNNKYCIEKYESLMRIIDENGKVYLPEDFIELAKKYHVYTQLNEKMIERVIKETENKQMIVSINLSAYDINSSTFRDKLYQILSSRTSKSLIVFEILEDEVFKDIVILKKFIRDVEKYRVKIAIDDFGSGYSNLLEIAEISPHYIKIDGRIIKKVIETEKNKAILESIVYLAKKINALTVAEHVENEQIQKCIEEIGIDFSQGYYFSKPVPIDNLK